MFGLTVPEDYGGLGLGKVAMCVVSEELSRGYIGVGSLGTRSEIAAELIRSAARRSRSSISCRRSPRARSCQPRCSPNRTPAPTWLRCAPARCATATSTRQRATRPGSPIGARRPDDVARPHQPDAPGYKGLSMLLAEKPRGTDDDPFPAGHDGRRDQGSRLSRHEGIRDGLRRFRGPGRRAARRRRGPGL